MRLGTRVHKGGGEEQLNNQEEQELTNGLWKTEVGMTGTKVLSLVRLVNV